MRSIDTFVPASSPQPLADDEIHLWFFPQWTTVGDAVESQAVRGLLAGYMGRPAADLRFARGDRGKPGLSGLQFNLSHSADALLLALSRHVELGVDLEAVTRRTSSVPELARRWFAPSEADALTALPQARQRAAFLDLWTCKEAVLKCLGHGISFGLHRVELELAAHSQVTGLRSVADTGAQLQLARLKPDSAHVGALAWRGKPLPTRAFVTQPIAGAAQSG